jgi:hypothetical protein
VNLVLNLPPDLEKELSAEADRLGLPLTEYAMRVLSTRQPTETAPTTGAELVDYWEREGLIGSRPDIPDSLSHARALRAEAERRTRN